jgi:hypothetical protein
MPRKGNALPRAFCMSPGVVARGEVKGLWPEAEAKASTKRANSRPQQTRKQTI